MSNSIQPYRVRFDPTELEEAFKTFEIIKFDKSSLIKLAINFGANPELIHTVRHCYVFVCIWQISWCNVCCDTRFAVVMITIKSKVAFRLLKLPVSRNFSNVWTIL